MSAADDEAAYYQPIIANLGRNVSELKAERDRARTVAVELEGRLARVEALVPEWERTAEECERLAHTRAGLSDEPALRTAALINHKRADNLRAALNPEATP